MGSHSKCRGGRGPGWPRLPPGQGSLPRLSGLRSPPKCPTSFALFMPSSLVLAGPRCMTLRRTLHLWGWTALWQHAAAPRLVQCPRALRAARSVVGHLFCSCPTFAHSSRRGTPPSLPCHLCPSALRPARARCGAIREAALPLCPLSLALSRPLSARPPSSSLAPLPRPLGPWPSISLSPSSLYPPGIHFAEQYARHPSHSLFTLPPPGALVPGLVARTSHCTRLRPLSLYARPASPSLPCPFPSRTLRRTLCRQVARMSQARTWPLSAASSGWLAPRCGRPPLPQPPQEPPPRAATPNAAGGAALVGPGCPPARVSLYPPRRLVAGGDPSQNPAILQSCTSPTSCTLGAGLHVLPKKHHAAAARRCHSPRRSRCCRWPFQMPRGARP